MAKEIINSVDAFEIVWMDIEFGWIRLIGNGKDAGYVYFIPDSDNLDSPHLGSTNYVVFTIHISKLPVFLQILRDFGPHEIRFFDPESPGVKPSAFIEPRIGTSLTTEELVKISNGRASPG